MFNGKKKPLQALHQPGPPPIRRPSLVRQESSVRVKIPNGVICPSFPASVAKFETSLLLGSYIDITETRGG